MLALLPHRKLVLATDQEVPCGSPGSTDARDVETASPTREAIVEARASTSGTTPGKLAVRGAARRHLHGRARRDGRDHGPERCGKTTLLNCLSGLDAIDGGEC